MKSKCYKYDIKEERDIREEKKKKREELESKKRYTFKEEAFIPTLKKVLLKH